MSFFKRYQWLILGLLCLLGWLWFNVASVHAASDPTNLKPAKQRLINDYAHVLTPGFKQHILAQNRVFQQMQQKPQVVLITVDSTAGQNPMTFANRILAHRQWSFVNQKQGRGVLLLYSLNGNNHNLQVVPGYGLNAILSSLSITQTLSTNYDLLTSASRQWNNYGLQGVFDAVSGTLMQNANRKVLPTSSQYQFGGGPGFFFGFLTFLFITCGGPVWLTYAFLNRHRYRLVVDDIGWHQSGFKGWQYQSLGRIHFKFDDHRY